jgi:hypothetical protein
MAWKAWISRRTRDVYVVARPFGGTWKMSLHESGFWHSGLAAKGLAIMPAPLPPYDRWQAPADFTPGVRRSVELVFPDVELRPWPAGLTDNKPVVAIPAPGEGHATCVELIFLAPEPPLRLEIDDAFSVGEINMSDLTKLCVLARAESSGQRPTPRGSEPASWRCSLPLTLLWSERPAILARSSMASTTTNCAGSSSAPPVLTDPLRSGWGAARRRGLSTWTRKPGRP